MFWKSQRKTHRIYLDAAAATPISPAARKALVQTLTVYGNPGALHQEALAAKAELDHSREIIATTIGAHADEIIFTSGGTEGNNLAIDGMLRPFLRAGGRVHAITSSIEHPSVLEPLRALQVEGVLLTELPVDEAGLVSAKDVAAAVTDDTVFVSVQMVNSEIGTIEPIREIAKEIRRIKKERAESPALSEQRPLYFHCDASQAPLWLSVGVEQLGVDLLTLDGQKICGPKGVGALYVRRGVPLEGQSRGGGQERGRRGGTENVLLTGSFAAALQEAQAHVDERVVRVTSARDLLYTEIARRIPTAVVNGAWDIPAPTPHKTTPQVRVANNLNISIPGLDGEMAVIALDAEGVAASTRSACDSSDEKPSHVLVALGLDQYRTKSAIRLTLLPTTKRSEVIQVAKILAVVADRYKSMA